MIATFHEPPFNSYTYVLTQIKVKGARKMKKTLTLKFKIKSR